MTVMAPRTIQATYENGLLRPLEPIQDAVDQVYLVTVLSIDTFRSRLRSQPAHDLRGKYRGYLSNADEFARSKQVGSYTQPP